jgi:hypothetical protein
MKKDVLDKLLFEDRLGCFGCFEFTDNVCLKLCALSLRCAIERDQCDRLEILEELVSSESLFLRTQ